ncbi:uncharacterized protein EV422DRAFT_546319 [Fimicolochytrium jonesii]|uniref:uncharacterized protein n=1 Tax=Fimicolochytrium jonesii TaxID=1396493 RepID=UPI0022FE04EE|nr:uncharacterized protein EV422DRAFT_546319 [Fimicolochytrium jonesii]KAI8816331.1 hypothetical protein EV422DRAFT_546319 [Fimicolochytrium jonesii]
MSASQCPTRLQASLTNSIRRGLFFSVGQPRPRKGYNAASRLFCTNTARRKESKVPHYKPLQTVRQFNPHLNYRHIRDNAASIKQNLLNRNVQDVDVDLIIQLYGQFVRTDFSLAELRRARNQNTAAMKTCGRDAEAERKQLAEAGRELKKVIAAKEAEKVDLQAKLYEEARHLPNDTFPGSPIGDESLAKVLSTHLTPRSSTFASGAALRTHMEIASLHDLVDFDRAGKVSGSSFYYLRNMGAMLEMALTRYAMDVCISHGFVPMITPDVVRHEVLEACGFHPRSEDPQTYYIAPQTGAVEQQGAARDPMQLLLTATAEFPLAAAHANETLHLSSLPIKQVASSHAFRAEGLSGALNRGLYRVHQFTKVEMFALTTKETSDTVFAEMVNVQKILYKGLDLCFRELEMPTQDLGAPAYRKIDIEAWMPGRQSWGEISSASICTDFQSRRLNMKYFTGSSTAAGATGTTGHTDFVHTINGTACAVPRLIIALLETHQHENGDVDVPEVLRPYLWGITTMRAGQSVQEMIANKGSPNIP